MLDCVERYNALKNGKKEGTKPKTKSVMPAGGGSLDDLPGW